MNMSIWLSTSLHEERTDCKIRHQNLLVHSPERGPADHRSSLRHNISKVEGLNASFHIVLDDILVFGLNKGRTNTREATIP